MTTAGGVTSLVTSNDVTVIPKCISLDQFDTWAAKLNLFVEHYLKPAFERSLHTEKVDEEGGEKGEKMKLLVQFNDATPTVASTMEVTG